MQRRKDSRERLVVIQNELDHILADIVQNRRERLLPAQGPDSPIDIIETAGEIHVRVDLPGVEKDGLAVFISRDVLFVEANKRSPYLGEKQRFFNLEREFGRLKREIVIPKPVDARGIVAKMENGVLLVSMPKISDRRGERKPVAVQ